MKRTSSNHPRGKWRAPHNKSGSQFVGHSRNANAGHGWDMLVSINGSGTAVSFLHFETTRAHICSGISIWRWAKKGSRLAFFSLHHRELQRNETSEEIAQVELPYHYLQMSWLDQAKDVVSRLEREECRKMSCTNGERSLSIRLRMLAQRQRHVQASRDPLASRRHNPLISMLLHVIMYSYARVYARSQSFPYSCEKRPVLRPPSIEYSKHRKVGLRPRTVYPFDMHRRLGSTVCLLE